jgi:hypothetical protein
MKMKKRSLLPISAILLSLCLAACSSGNRSVAAPTPNPSAAVSSAPGYSFETSVEAPSEAPNAGATDQAVRESKLIRRANLTVESQEFDAAVAALDKLVKDKGGYYESNNLQQGTYYDVHAARYGDFTIRVPQDQFESFLNAAGDVGHVVSRSQSSEDVGEAYYDAEIRLKTQQTKHERLLSLLEKADNMENIIALETALSDVEYEIERLTGTLRRYDSLVGYSTITLRLNEVLKLTEQPKETASLGGRVTNAFSGGLQSVGQNLGNLAVWGAYHFIGILIFLAVAAAVAFFARREYRKLRTKDKGE